MAFDIAGFYQDFILNRVVTAAIIFFLGFMLGKISGSLSKRILAEIELNRRTVNTFFGRMNIERFISTIISYSIYLTTIIMALNRLLITEYILYGIIFFLLFLIFAGVFFELKDLLPNLYSWLRIKKMGYFDVGDNIKIPLAEGVVKKITMLNTRIITEHGDELYIKNRNVLENLKVEKKK